MRTQTQNKNNVEYLNQDYLTLKGNFVYEFLYNNYAESSYRTCEEPIRTFFNVDSISHITLEMLQNTSHNQVERYFRQHRGQKYLTLNKKRCVLSKLYEYVNALGMQCDIEVKNYFDSMLIKQLVKNLSSSSTNTVEVFTKKEREKLYSVIKLPRDYVFFKVLFNAGLRISEAVNLRPSNIIYSEEAYWIVVFQGKGDKSRLIPITREIRYLLDKIEYKNDKYFDFTQDNANKMIKRYSKKAGIQKKKISPHITRHTYASALRANNVPLEKIQQYLGHSDIGTTIKYIHQIDQSADLHSIIDGIEEL